jgi:hypothetical protein
VAVLVVAIVALRHPKGRSVQAGRHTGTATAAAPSTPPVSTPHTATSAPSSPAGSGTSTTTSGTAAKQPLVVLNNTTITGLAQQAAQRFSAGGWTVSKYDNYQNDIVSTCAYYDPSVPGAEAAAQALQQQFPAIKRVKPQFAELASWHSPIVVILTPDYSSG